jgi:hypothetical protein
MQIMCINKCQQFFEEKRMSNLNTNCSSLSKAALHNLAWLSAAFLLLCSVPASGGAAALYGHISQLDPPIVAVFNDMACAPTAVVNSFVYLDNAYGATLLPDAGSDQDVINLGYAMGTTTSGTTNAGMVTGKYNWIQEYDPRVQMSVQYTPTWEFIQSELAAGEDVEACLAWANGGGHCLTLTNDQLNNQGNGTLSFVDPWGGVDLSGTLTNNNGVLDLSYSGGAAGSGNSGTIDMVISESIPEPATLMLLGLGGLILRKRR